MPPPPPGQADGSTVQIPFDAEKVLRPILVGNWVAAGAVALTALLVSGVLSLAFVLVAKPADFGIDNTLASIASMMAAAFGADLKATSAHNNFDGALSLGWFPLTITLATLFASAFVFRRVTARYGKVSAALADGARAAFLTAIPLTAIALIFRADNDKFGPTSLRYFAAGDNEKQLVDLGASAVGSFFMSLLVMLVVLALTCVLRRDWLPAKVARVHDWLAAPLWGVVTIGAALPVAGAIGVASVFLFGDNSDTSGFNTDEWMTLIGVTLAYLANAGFGVLTLGSGASLGSEGSYHGGGEKPGGSDEFHRLAYFASSDHVNEPGLWVSVAVVPVVLLLAAYVVARKSGHRGAVMGNLLRYSALLLVAIPLLSRLASVHANVSLSHVRAGSLFGSIGFDKKFSATGYVGANGLEVTVFLFLIGALAAALIGALTGALDVNKLKGQATDIAKQMQAQPDQQPYAQQGYAQQGYAQHDYAQQDYGQEPAYPTAQQPVAPTTAAYSRTQPQPPYQQPQPGSAPGTPPGPQQ